MSSRMPDPQRQPTDGSPPPEARTPLRLRSGLGRAAAVTGTALLVAVAALGTGVGAERLAAPAAVQVRDTTPDGDLLCLTRRPQDCLDEPVPTDEPHGAVCSTCHNLWQSDPAAVRSCTDAGCHETPEALATFHGTVDVSALAECTDCHAAHGFRVPEDGQDCRVCHQGGGDLPLPASPGTPHRADALDFAHDDHTSVACASCHGAGESHTAVRVTERGDCRSCHHARDDEGDACLSCHVLDEVVGVAFPVERALDIRIGSLDRPRRLLPFDHENHWTNGCTTCHTGGPDLGTTDGADCSGCHFEHHEPTSTCATCHEPPAAGAHDRQVHLGCGGAGCHDPLPPGLVPTPRTRNLCLACHGDRADHQSQQTCSACHLLPEPRAAGDGAPAPGR